MGAADVLETFVIHGQTSASISAESAEEARIIIQFPISGTDTAIETIHRDRNDNKIPAQGKVSFYLRMFNAPHAESTPEDFDLDVKIISKVGAKVVVLIWTLILTQAFPVFSLLHLVVPGTNQGVIFTP